MKNWTSEEWIRFVFTCCVCYCLSMYFTGMFILKQATNDANKELRMALVTLLTVVASNIVQNRSDNKKKDEDK